MPFLRPLSRMRLGWRLGWAILLVALPPLSAADRPERPPFYAIQNARLVTGTGEIIERGTIVVAEGLISEVGARATIPPEAWVIDGSGLTVYPGLIDSLTDLGLEAEPQEKTSNSPGPISSGPEDRPTTSTWKRAADELKTTDKRIESWRNAGFTTAVTVHSKGIFPGQAACINLAGERSREMVVHTPAALRINLDPPGGFRSFPGSLMGVMAYVRQVFADADHYEQALMVYRAASNGVPRPTYDRNLEPLVKSKSEGWPILISATWSKEIHRAVRLGEDIDANTVVYGAHQGYAAAEFLREKNVPVLVSAKWPERSQDADPEADIPLRVLRFWDRAPSTPAALQEAGVRFAFYSDGLEAPKDFIKNVKQAIEAGLPQDAALRALTLSPAEIYGLEDIMGSLQAGKIANLVVMDGDLFDEASKVEMVFIDGEKYTVREEESPKDQETPAGLSEGGQS